MATDANLTGSGRVRKLQTALNVKAKEEPDRRFHALIDKVWREDFLMEAWKQVRRNGGSAGVDGEAIADIEALGVEKWVGELAQDLKDGTYVPKPVRQVLIPKKQRGKFRPLGIPCLRDRVAQTSAMLVLEPILEADLQPEQYAYRPGRSAHDAVNRVHSLLNRGCNEVVDCDLSNYFGEIPHAELIRSVARRVSDGRMLRLIKAWLEMPVEEDDGKGGKRRTNAARRERKGTPQGSPISPLLSNLYMRRFILGWQVLGHAQRFCARSCATRMTFASSARLRRHNAAGRSTAHDEAETTGQRTEDPMFAVPGGTSNVPRIPDRRNYRADGRGAYIGTRPSTDSVQNICRTISKLTVRRHGSLPAETVVERLNGHSPVGQTTFAWGRSARPTEPSINTLTGGCANGSAGSTR